MDLKAINSSLNVLNHKLMQKSFSEMQNGSSEELFYRFAALCTRLFGVSLKLDKSLACRLARELKRAFHWWRYLEAKLAQPKPRDPATCHSSSAPQLFRSLTSARSFFSWQALHFFSLFLHYITRSSHQSRASLLALNCRSFFSWQVLHFFSLSAHYITRRSHQSKASLSALSSHFLDTSRKRPFRQRFI